MAISTDENGNEYNTNPKVKGRYDEQYNTLIQLISKNKENNVDPTSLILMAQNLLKNK